MKRGEPKAWVRAMGCCLVCGTPMAVPGGKLDHSNSVAATAQEGEASDAEGPFFPEDDVRVCLFKYRLLQGHEHLHLVEEYTFLKQEWSEFAKGLLAAKIPEFLAGYTVREGGPAKQAEAESEDAVKAKGEDAVKAKGEDAVKAKGEDVVKAKSEAVKGDEEQPDLMADLSQVYETGRERGQHIGSKWLMAGCAACNSAMNKRHRQWDDVFLTLDPARRKGTGDVSISGKKTPLNDLKKTIQSIILFFEVRWDRGRYRWRARDEESLIANTCIYRVISNLVLWGKEGHFRYKLIALFYASWYLYARTNLGRPPLFEQWHIHLFRPFYAATFKPGTFFGMTRAEAAAEYTVGHAISEPTAWYAATKARLDQHLPAVAELDKPSLEEIAAFESGYMQRVTSEFSLFLYETMRRRNPDTALQAIMGFLRFNIAEEPSAWHMRMCERRFSEDMRRLLSRLLRDQSEKEARTLQRSGGAVESIENSLAGLTLR